jgi:hypothetical protein
MPQVCNLLDDFGTDNNPVSSQLTQLRLDGDTQPFIVFTADGARADVHYVKDSGREYYVLCNAKGDGGCVLCKAGYKPGPRVCLPVYPLLASAVQVLVMSTAMYPGALLPQVRSALNSGGPRLLNVSKRDKFVFDVVLADLDADIDRGEEAILAFKEKFDRGEVDLTSVFQRLDNRALAELKEVQIRLKAKGVRSDDGGSR